MLLLTELLTHDIIYSLWFMVNLSFEFYWVLVIWFLRLCIPSDFGFPASGLTLSVIGTGKHFVSP